MNIIWGTINFIIGYVLICGVGDFVGGLSVDALMVAIGALVAAAAPTLHFGRVRGS